MTFNDIYKTARPYLASFVILRKQDSIAMVLRKNTGWMDGYWGLPAGKVEYFEHFTNGAIREAAEEAGVTIARKDLKFIHAAHRHDEDKTSGLFIDWVDIYFEAVQWQGEPYNAEQEKSEELAWHSLQNLPENVVPSQRAALLQIAKGTSYSEFGWGQN